MTTLASLISQIESDVPEMNGVPTTAQYSTAVRDAVADLGRRAPLTKVATLSIVSGTASYDLPADFAKVIRLESLASPDGVIVSSAGLIPVSRTTRERWITLGTTIAFSPTPAYTLDRELWYAATYALDADDNYPDLSDDRAQIALMRARSVALNQQAAKAAPTSLRVKSGDDDVDRTKVAEALKGMAAEWRDQYEAAVKTLNGPVGMRG